MIEVTFGTGAMVEHYRVDVRAQDMTAKELGLMAQEAGVDDSGTKEMIAARLSAVTRKQPVDGLRVLTCRFPDDMSLMEIANTITIGRGIWDSWTAGDLAASPAPIWVASDSPAIQALLAGHYGCTQGAPADLEDTHYTEHGPAGVGPDMEVRS